VDQPDTSFDIPEDFDLINGPSPTSDADDVSEFGWGGDIYHLLRYWTKERRAAKADKQRRVQKGREEGGQFAPEPGAFLDIPGLGKPIRARTDTTPEVSPLALTPGYQRKAGTAPGSEMNDQAGMAKRPAPVHADVEIVRLPPAAGMAALRAAGFDPRRHDRWDGRGVVYRIDTGGPNPGFVFIANPDAMVEHKTQFEREEFNKAKQRVKNFKIKHQIDIAMGDVKARNELKDLERKAAEVREEYRQALNGYTDKLGLGGDEAIGEWEDGLAAEAAAYLKEQLRLMPPERRRGIDGKAARFMIEFDESQLLVGDSGKTVQANSHNGQEIMTFDRTRFRNAITNSYQAQVMRTDKATQGQYAFAHEFGHLMDAAWSDDAWSSTKWGLIWNEFRDILSTYGKSNAHEAFAEMWAFSGEHPNDPKAIKFLRLVDRMMAMRAKKLFK
jgi:hypothetical protein